MWMDSTRVFNAVLVQARLYQRSAYDASYSALSIEFDKPVYPNTFEPVTLPLLKRREPTGGT
jgi:hypothetical protein